MKKIALIVLGVIVLLVVGFVIVVAMQPNEMHIRRSATIPSPPAIVFDQVNDLSKSLKWSPFTKLDPNSKYTFEGPAAGEGAKYHWDGNDKVGAGSVTIVESKPHEHIKQLLAFIRPMEGEADAIYTFKSVDGGEATEVTWEMLDEHTFGSKAMCLLMNMNAQLSAMFDEGLANLKETSAQAEEEAAAPETETPVEVSTASP